MSAMALVQERGAGLAGTGLKMATARNHKRGWAPIKKASVSCTQSAGEPRAANRFLVDLLDSEISRTERPIVQQQAAQGRFERRVDAAMRQAWLGNLST